MRKITVITTLILLAIVLQVSADPISLFVCRLREGVYQFSFTGAVDGWWFNNFISADLVTLIASGDGAEFVVYYDGTTESIFADPDQTPACSRQSDWQPGAPSIVIPLLADCSFVEIKNIDPQTGQWDGGWSRVESQGEPVLLHYGQALIGSNSESIDPADYRAIPTECY